MLQELLDVIEEMEREKLQLLRDRDMLESEIRTEVCAEMAKQFSEIEEQCR